MLSLVPNRTLPEPSSPFNQVAESDIFVAGQDLILITKCSIKGDEEGNKPLNTMTRNLNHTNWREPKPNKDPPSDLFCHPAYHPFSDPNTLLMNCVWAIDFALSHLLPTVIAKEE
jgi:hypothetical protein